MWSISINLLFFFTLVSGRRYGGGSHSYPSSSGYSGSRGNTHTYPNSGNSGNTYVQRTNTPPRTNYPPTSQSGSGTHRYPQSTGLSGNTYVQQKNTQHHNINYGHKTEVHHHYHYNPPQQISYGSTYHPVYRAAPPVYVYEYRDSGSRFDSLLTGLALYNLGRMSANSQYNNRREYVQNPYEICKLGISKQNGDYEETRIDCKLMSSFIWEAETRPPQTNQQVEKTVTTSVVQNKTSSANSLVTTVITQQKTVVDALQVKGPSIKVTNGMICYMIRISRVTSILKKQVECGLLQAYSQNSLQYRNKSDLLVPYLTVVSFFAYILVDW